MSTEGTTADPGTISVVLADDHAVVRSALRMLLEAEAGVEVIAEAGTAEDALRRVRGNHPDVLVLDLEMPGRPSLEVLPDLAEASPETSVVILTMRNEPEYARAALRGGVKGYVLKEAADTELVNAVRRAAAGETYLQPGLGAKLANLNGYNGNGLSDREREVLKLVALGHTNAEISEQLFLSIRTVESHRANIQKKLGLNSRAELVRYALDRGLIGS